MDCSVRRNTHSPGTRLSAWQTHHRQVFGGGYFVDLPSSVEIWVVPTDESRVAAQDALAFLQK
jgi:hypothetical protein